MSKLVFKRSRRALSPDPSRQETFLPRCGRTIAGKGSCRPNWGCPPPWLGACVVLVLLANLDRPASAQEESQTLIRAKHVYTVEGQVFSPGEVLVKNGRIAFVGSSAEMADPPQQVLEVDTLIPGIVNASSSAGLSGGDAEVSREVTPDFDTYSAIDWRSREFVEAVDQGVTTVQILPDTDSVFSGFACVVKTAGEPHRRTLSKTRGVVLAVCSDPTSRNRSRARPDSIYVRQPTNRMGVVWIIRNALHQTRQGDAAVGLDPNTQSILQGIVEGRLPVLSVSRADFDVRSALDLGRELGFQPTIYGGDEIYRMVEEFKQSKMPLVYTALTTNATTRSLRGAEGTDLRWNVPGKLQAAGIDFCLAGSNLLEQARFAVRFGLSEEEALQAVTLRPARFMNLDDRVGSIRAGKEADLVALSGHPMQATSAVVWTMVDGQIYGKSESKTIK